MNHSILLKKKFIYSQMDFTSFIITTISTELIWYKYVSLVLYEDLNYT